MRRRLVGVVAAATLALTGTLVLVSYVSRAHDKALAGEPKTSVYVVADAIGRGTAGGDVGQRVITRELPSSAVAAGSVTDLADIAGKVAAVDLVPGEQLLASRFVATDELERPGLPPGKLEVTISLAPERALGGQLQRGDTVAVVASIESDQIGVDVPAGPITSIILHKVRVTNVRFGGAVPAEDSRAEEDEAGVGTTPGGNLLVGLALDAPDVEKVVFAAEYGSLWLSAEPGGADSSGGRITTKESVFR